MILAHPHFSLWSTCKFCLKGTFEISVLLLPFGYALILKYSSYIETFLQCVNYDESIRMNQHITLARAFPLAMLRCAQTHSLVNV